MPGNMLEIPVARQHRQIAAQAELRQQRIDRADLNAAAPASVSQFRRVHMVALVRHQQRQRSKPFEDLSAVPRPG